MRKISTLIRDFKIKTIIGVLPHEREAAQMVLINADFVADEFLDYVVLKEFISASFERHKFLFVEQALDTIANELKAEFAGLLELWIELIKLEILPDAKVGASIRVSF